MHILERYALGTGLKIGKPYIYEKYYPMDADKYITLHPRGKYESRNYDYWEEVVNLIHGPLSEEGISIVQIGVKDDLTYPFCYRTNGTTDLNQVAYIIKNCILHLGVDSFPVHLASHYDKKIVGLYPNMYPSMSRPYWGDEKNSILIEPPRGEMKPSYSAEEDPKTINTISPEKIARMVLELLGISHAINTETIYRGKLYSNKTLIYEATLDRLVDTKSSNMEKLLCRLDFNHNEENLEKQLQVSRCELVCDKPIKIELLKKYLPNIAGVIYHVEEDDSPEFVNGLSELGIPYALVSNLDSDILMPKKLNYMDHEVIREIKLPKPLENELKGRDINKLFYKSNKFTLSKGKIYPSRYAWEKDLPTQQKDELSKVVDDPVFWKESNNFTIIQKGS